MHRDMVLHDIWDASENWINDSVRWRGTVLHGLFTHWCNDWDGLPIDETSLEFPCGCEHDIAEQLRNEFGVIVNMKEVTCSTVS
jgi:hypothetical protein